MGNLVWEWNNFKGGESDAKREGPPASYQSSLGLEMLRVPGEVSLSNTLVDTGWSFSDDIYVLEDLAQYGGSGVLVCCDDGTIYLNGTLKHTIASGYDSVIGVAYMVSSGTEYLYYITSTSSGTGKIHRSTMDCVTWSEDHLTFTAQNGAGNLWNRAVTISEATRFIFGIGGMVFEVDNAETLTTKLTFSESEDILAMTVFQNQYKIYSNINKTHGVQYVWDGYSDEFDYKTDWKNLPMTAGVNDSGYDFVTTGRSVVTSDLYRVAGTQREPVKVNDGNQERNFDEYISIREGMVYVSGAADDSAGSSREGIFVYGNFYPGSPKALVKNYSIAGTGEQVTLHTHGEQISHFVVDEDKVYELVHNSSNTIHQSGEMISLIFDGGPGNRYIKKNLQYAYVGFSGTSSTKTIKIYIRADEGGWDLLKTINNDYSNERGVRIDRSEFVSAGIVTGDFYDLEYKVVLDTTSSTSSPIFRGIETYITTGIEK